MARLLAIAAVMVALLAAAPAAHAVAPPYALAPGMGANELTVRAADGGSTLAVSVTRTGGNAVFVPRAASAPMGPGQCTQGMTSGPDPKPATLCPIGLMSSVLDFEADVLQVDVTALTGVSKLQLTGGPDADTMRVTSSTVATVEMRTGTGPDLVALTGTIGAISDESDADTSDDSYLVLSPGATGGLDPAGGDDVVETNSKMELSGGEGNDVLTSQGVLHGDAGDDLLRPRLPGIAVSGDAGTDRVSFDGLAGPLKLTLATFDSVKVGNEVTASIATIEEVEGSDGGDTITGVAPTDVAGDDKADVLAGGKGDDTLIGDDGADRLDGGPGVDTVSYVGFGGPLDIDLGAGTGGSPAGIDALDDFEKVVGTTGVDSAVGTDAVESFDMRGGNDVVSAGGGGDTLLGGDGDDSLRGEGGSDTIDGGAGSDTVLYDERGAADPVTVTLAGGVDDGAPGENDALAGIENVAGTAGADTITGSDADPNVLIGNGGRDTLDGLDGSDALHGGPENDKLFGGPGSDQLFGDAGSDEIFAFDSIADLVSCGEDPGDDDDAQVDSKDDVRDCEFFRRLDVAGPADRDADGVVEGTDCDDRNPAVKPGATDPPGDGIDQNCDGRDSALPVIDAGFRFGFDRPSRRGTKITVLELSRLPARSRVVISCRTTAQFPGRCPFRRVTRNRGGSATVKLTSLFKRRTLPVGTRIELTISAPGHLTKIRRYTVRRTSAPRMQDLCQAPGARTPTACPQEDS